MTPALAEMKRLTCSLTFDPAAFQLHLSQSVNTLMWCMAACSNKRKADHFSYSLVFTAEFTPGTLFCRCHAAPCTTALPQRLISHGQDTLSYPGGFDFVASVAHPARVVGERLAFLPLQARLHLAPPLPNYYGCYRQQTSEIMMQVTVSHSEW